MSTLISNATIKVRRDTASSWTTNNPIPNQGEICFETDTGNMKIGDGSTAWTSLAYYVPMSLPYDYDISSADKTHTLPTITGAPQEVNITWSGGDGTYDLTIYESDGTTALDYYKGEGEGHIRIVSTGSAWKVVDYEDSWGNGITGWRKTIDGAMEQWNTGSASLPATTAYGSLYYGNTSTGSYSFLKDFFDTNYSISITALSSGIGTVSKYIKDTTKTFHVIAFNGTSATFSFKIVYRGIGTWK